VPVHEALSVNAERHRFDRCGTLFLQLLSLRQLTKVLFTKHLKYKQQTIFIECHFMVVATFLHRETDEHLAEFWVVIDELLLLDNAHFALAIVLPPLLLELGRLSEFERTLTLKPMRQSAKVTGNNTQPSTVSKLRDRTNSIVGVRPCCRGWLQRQQPSHS
jgi:hypothetical protein